MNPTRNWKRLLVVGCSHGALADKVALDQVLGFADRWQPHTVIHLGDFVDFACFRSGAAGTSDEAADPETDLAAGLEFVSALFAASAKIKERVLYCGNHEDRVFQLAHHPRKMIAAAAAMGVVGIRDTAKKFKAELVEYDIETGWRTYGDAIFGHGYMFSEQGLRDHAETFGKCVIAHLHRAGVANARRLDHAVARCVGTLANIPAMAYAKTKRARLAWSQGFVFGEYCDTEAALWLVECAQGHQWRTPL